MAVNRQRVRLGVARRSRQPPPFAPSSWRYVSPEAVACNRPVAAAREVPRPPRTRTRSRERDGTSLRPLRRRRWYAWLRMRRPPTRKGPEVSTLLAFVPRERTVDVQGKCKDPSPIAARTGSCRVDEKSGKRRGDAHGFLGKAMVRNPLNYGRLRTAASTLPRAADAGR